MYECMRVLKEAFEMRRRQRAVIDFGGRAVGREEGERERREAERKGEERGRSGIKK